MFLLGEFVTDFEMGLAGHNYNRNIPIGYSLWCQLPGYLIVLGPGHFIVFELATTHEL